MKSIRTRVTEIAWRFRKDSLAGKFQNGRLINFSMAMKIAWEIVKKWSGAINECVEIEFSQPWSRPGRQGVDNLTFGIVIRN